MRSKPMNSQKPYPKVIKTTKGGKPAASETTGKPKGKKRHSFGLIIMMALVKYAGTGAIGISGKIAGTVFTLGGQQGPFMRVWAKPRNRRTSFQTAVRGLLSGISSSFRSLTAPQVDAWNAAAADDSPNSLRRNVFGDIRRLSGSQMFQRVNNIVTSLGVAVFSDVPTPAATDAIISMVATAAETGQTFDLDITTFDGATAVPADTFVQVYATAQKGNGRSFFGKSQFRLIGFYPTTTAINPLDISADYIAKFGALVAGSRIGIEARFVFADATQFGFGGKVNGTVSVAP